MKRITVIDTPGGHAVGWDPDGITTTFSISDTDIPTINGVYIDANVEFAGNVV